MVIVMIILLDDNSCWRPSGVTFAAKIKQKLILMPSAYSIQSVPKIKLSISCVPGHKKRLRSASNPLVPAQVPGYPCAYLLSPPFPSTHHPFSIFHSILLSALFCYLPIPTLVTISIHLSPPNSSANQHIFT